MAFNHQEIDKKWQNQWESTGVFHAKDNSDKPKFYCLIEFPYPSGAGLHVGHPRPYIALDVIARKRRMEGNNVLYPIGWDAFGLPTENYAIKTGRKPQDVTAENIATFTRQIKSLGISFDWSREINTTDPEYFKWTQWMFLEFFKAGLAYKASMPINWCLSCKTGLANEEVIDGSCERCGGQTEKRDKQQWMIAITKYADRLTQDLEGLDYLEKIKAQQRNWIGKSEGAEIAFDVMGSQSSAGSLKVFTTRPDTLFGVTFLAIAPDHPLIQQYEQSPRPDGESGIKNFDEVKAYIASVKNKTEIERTGEQTEKSGVKLEGLYAVNPANGEHLPIFVVDYVLMNYGTGAIMAVPAHDERDFGFAQKYHLPVRVVVQSPVLQELLGEDLAMAKGAQSSIQIEHDCYVGEGIAINSGFLNGLSTQEATKQMIAWLAEKGVGEAKTTFKLRDWVFSRQRYWGEPIPLVHCQKCEWVPVPEDQLPVCLPEVEKYEPSETGESPLAAITDWVNTTCPTCGGPAQRETDTMPNWAGSSWYFLAYAMKHTNNFAFPMSSYKEILKQWMPVDWYNGGMEHTTLHLLYSRFWNKFLFDRGYVSTSEPYTKRTSHGLVMAEDGSKMSKSKGNVVNPDQLVEAYGADALRVYELFIGPFAEPVPWQTNGLVGMRRFLEKTTNLVDLIAETESKEVTRALHQTIKKVSEDVEAMRFNTAVSAMMMFVNTVKEQGSITKESFNAFLIVLCLFAPHLANELNQQTGGTEFLETYPWPAFNPALIVEDVIQMAVQINGKARGLIQIAPDAEESVVMELATTDPNIQKYLEGQVIKKVVYVKGRILNIVL